MPNNAAPPPKDEWPTDWLENTDDSAMDAAIKMIARYAALRNACLVLGDPAWAIAALREYRREHRDEINAALRQMAHAMEIRWELHRRRAFAVRNRMTPEELAQVVADCIPPRWEHN